MDWPSLTELTGKQAKHKAAKDVRNLLHKCADPTRLICRSDTEIIEVTLEIERLA